MSDSSAFETLNVKDELALFGLEHAKFTRKFISKSGPQVAMWKKLHNFAKKCNTEEGSADTTAISESQSDLRANCGYVLFTFMSWEAEKLYPKMDQAKRAKLDLNKQKKRVCDFIKDKLPPNVMVFIFFLFVTWNQLFESFLENKNSLSKESLSK